MADQTAPFALSGDPTSILNWRRMTGRFTTSGQPTDAQLGDLKALGVTRVINLGLHSHEKALPDERRALAVLGIDYDHIPVDFARPAEADFERYCAIMSEAGTQVVHVHCIYNARVSAFVFRQCKGGPDSARSAALLDSIWRPGGVWARYIGKDAEVHLPDRYAGRDY